MFPGLPLGSCEAGTLLSALLSPVAAWPPPVPHRRVVSQGLHLDTWVDCLRFRRQPLVIYQKLPEEFLPLGPFADTLRLLCLNPSPHKNPLEQLCHSPVPSPNCCSKVATFPGYIASGRTIMTPVLAIKRRGGCAPRARESCLPQCAHGSVLVIHQRSQSSASPPWAIHCWAHPYPGRSSSTTRCCNAPGVLLAQLDLVE